MKKNRIKFPIFQVLSSKGGGGGGGSDDDFIGIIDRTAVNPKFN